MQPSVTDPDTFIQHEHGSAGSNRYPEKRFTCIVCNKTDNGSAFLSLEFKVVLQENKLTQSMVYQNTQTKNAFIEMEKKTVREETDSNVMLNYQDAVNIIKEIVSVYNTKRRHSSLHYLTPRDYYRGDPEDLLRTRQFNIDNAKIKKKVQWRRVHFNSFCILFHFEKNSTQLICKTAESFLSTMNVPHERIYPTTPSEDARIEWFNSILERELIRRFAFESFHEAKSTLGRFVYFYNKERLYIAIRYITPSGMNKKCMGEIQKA